jgi:hypothetical protein
MSDDYLCLTVVSLPGEGESAFKSRLSQFWTHMLRNHKDDFEKVYAETVKFGAEGNRVTRQYLVEATVVDLLEREMSTAGIAHEPIDRDDTYSKFEATPPDWMWIEH